MTDALKYWVREVGIDGYRGDVAGFVPLDFWNNARQELDAIKPVFMLAEWEATDLHAGRLRHDLCLGLVHGGARRDQGRQGGRSASAAITRRTRTRGRQQRCA